VLIRRLMAAAAAFAAVGAVAIALPSASSAAPACASPWSSSAVYVAATVASYNSHNWSAKWWTQNETPGVADVWADQGACGGGGGGGTPPPTCNYPNWVAGQSYATGAIVRYTDGNYYIAEHDNPGYDPVISTWFWDPFTCGGGGTPPPGDPSGFVVSEAQFNQMFPGRNQFYTYSGLTTAMSAFPGFAMTGSDTVRKQEAAAFLANVAHETGGLVFIVEQNTANYPHYCGRHPALRLPGRPSRVLRPRPDPAELELQLQGSRRRARYRPAPQPLPGRAGRGGRLEDRPLVLEHPNRPGTMTPHNAMVNGAGFGRNDPQHQRQHRMQRRQPSPGAEPNQQLHPLRRHPRRPRGQQPFLLTLLCRTAFTHLGGRRSFATDVVAV